MKKVWRRMMCSLLILACCIFPSTAMATEGKETDVIVTVENEGDLLEIYGDIFDGNGMTGRRSTVDLSEGQSSFTIGVLSAGGKYTTDTYDISKTRIKVGLQSIGGESPHIKVTLYKSSGVSVAVSTVSLPWSTPLGGGGSKTVTFSNLDYATNYYVVIENMDTTTTGTILCVVKQA